MTNLMGNGEGHTLLILTDEEARNIREAIGNGNWTRAIAAYKAGVQRGTDRLKAEFDAKQKRKKAEKK